MCLFRDLLIAQLTCINITKPESSLEPTGTFKTSTAAHVDLASTIKIQVPFYQKHIARH